MAKVRDWIGGFLVAHSERFKPADWPRSGTPELRQFTSDWLRAMAVLDPPATLDEATTASESLLLTPPDFRRQHIPAIVAAIKARRAATAPGRPAATSCPDPAQVEARERSRDCPECRGTGWAQRFVLWHSIRRPFAVDLFCRCAYGRWHKAHDPDEIRDHDDLQAQPELWNPTMTFAGWAPRPIVPDLVIDPDCEGRWRYLGLDEPTPRAIRPADLADALAGRGGWRAEPPDPEANP